jgi:hypothetical protein
MPQAMTASRSEGSMSGLLFLASIVGFIVIVLWAYKNDGLKADELGSGLLAMRLTSEAKQKSVPKWKKSAMPERSKADALVEKPAHKARWQKTFQYGKSH